MALSYDEQVENLEGVIKQNQIEDIVDSISPSNVKTSVEKMKKGIYEIAKAMENAHNITYKNKILTEEMKIKLSRKKDEIEKLEDKLENTKKHIESDTRKVSELQIEINKIRIAIEKIKEVERNLGQGYLEQSQNNLVNALVKITSDAEKAQSDLNVAKKVEEITFKKIGGIENDFNKLKLYTMNKISETEKMITNVSIATEHITKSYDEITTVSKELLKSAISTTIGLEEDPEIEQKQQRQDFTNAKVLI